MSTSPVVLVPIVCCCDEADDFEHEMTWPGDASCSCRGHCDTLELQVSSRRVPRGDA
jgi:hypothetical protein